MTILLTLFDIRCAGNALRQNVLVRVHDQCFTSEVRLHCIPCHAYYFWFSDVQKITFSCAHAHEHDVARVVTIVVSRCLGHGDVIAESSLI
jgi:hypothetical protein